MLVFIFWMEHAIHVYLLLFALPAARLIQVNALPVLIKPIWTQQLKHANCVIIFAQFAKELTFVQAAYLDTSFKMEPVLHMVIALPIAILVEVVENAFNVIQATLLLDRFACPLYLDAPFTILLIQLFAKFVCQEQY